MNGTDIVTNHWAVLIGINFYADGNSLEGCVRDVKAIKQYLEAEIEPVDIITFTSSKPSDSNSRHPVEVPDAQPTFENITSSLEGITRKANPGDFICIHYSGHGTRMKDTSTEYSNENTGDLALVLFDDVHGSRYLRGLELAHLLDKMVKKGLFVTLVLDCCFSGSVVRHGNRHDAGIRAVDYNPTIDAIYPQKLCTNSSDQVGTSRDAQILPKWLIDPDGYTILSACGPHETAKELKFKGGDRNGALSYFLVQALGSLRKSGVEVTHQSLYHYLCSQFHAYWPQQNPMRYGNKNFSFFGKPRLEPDTNLISVFRAKDGRLCLEAGRAHGVHEGDEYAVYPFNSPAVVSNEVAQGLVRLRVDTVRGLSSDLVEIESTPSASRVKTGWKARPLTHLSPREILVRLISSVGDPAQWIAAAKQRRFLRLSTENIEGEPYLFNLVRNGRDECEILDESHRKISGLPAIPFDGNRALDRIMDVLEHLATFKYFEGIENRIPMSFKHSFKIDLNHIVGATGFLDVSDGDVLRLTIKNCSDKPLYLAIFDLGPSWQINSLLCPAGRGDFMVVLPKDKLCGGEEEILWKMSVPESFKSQCQYQCEDVIKVFVTNKPSSFAPLTLPEIHTSLKGSNGGVRNGNNQLSMFLPWLDTHCRGGVEDTPDEWETRNFLIRTIASQETQNRQE